jgi:predicted ATPase
VYTDFRARHFKLFDDVSVQLAPVTIISGRNNTGKTALLRAVFLHASGPRAGRLAASRVLRGRLPEGQTVWDSNFRNSDTGEPIILSATFNGSRAEVTFSVNPSIDSELSDQTDDSDNEEISSQSLTIVVNYNGKSETYIQTIPLSSVSRSRLDPPGKPLVPASYLGSRATVNQTLLAELYSDLRVLGRQEDLLNAIKEVDSRLTGIEVLVTDGQPTLHLSMVGYSYPVPLTQFGDGMAAAINILSRIYSKRAEILLIDEVENGIHYTVLPSFWMHIKRAAQATGTQIIATTHSRECIQAAQGAFAAVDADGLRLLRLWRKSPESGVSVSSYEYGDIESALELGLDVR